MLRLAHGWTADTERGPNWLVVRLKPPAQSAPATDALAEVLFQVLDEHSTYRVVLDLKDVPAVRSAMLNEILRLRQRVASHEGVVRLCGLSEPARDVMHRTRLDEIVSAYASPAEAIMAARPVGTA